MGLRKVGHGLRELRAGDEGGRPLLRGLRSLPRAALPGVRRRVRARPALLRGVRRVGCLADDFVLRDHRTLGLGALGREEWIESLRVLADLAPGWSLETVRILAWNRHGRVDVSRHLGTTRDGGPFENIFIRVVLTEGDRIQSNDTFDAAEVDRALARFEDLCTGRP